MKGRLYMAQDLSRCSNTYCPKKDTCYRYMPKEQVEEYQKYSVSFDVICTANTNYIYYSPLEHKPE